MADGGIAVDTQPRPFDDLASTLDHTERSWIGGREGDWASGSYIGPLRGPNELVGSVGAGRKDGGLLIQVPERSLGLSD